MTFDYNELLDEEVELRLKLSDCYAASEPDHETIEKIEDRIGEIQDIRFDSIIEEALIIAEKVAVYKKYETLKNILM